MALLDTAVSQWLRVQGTAWGVGVVRSGPESSGARSVGTCGEMFAGFVEDLRRLVTTDW